MPPLSCAVALTKVKKKDREWKEGIFAKVHALCDEYPAIYAFRYFNMRNERLKELRQELTESSRFMLASTKKVQAALGRTPEDEYKDNLHQLSEQVHGFAGLFCTKLPHDEVRLVHLWMHTVWPLAIAAFHSNRTHEVCASSWNDENILFQIPKCARARCWLSTRDFRPARRAEPPPPQHLPRPRMNRESKKSLLQHIKSIRQAPGGGSVLQTRAACVGKIVQHTSSTPHTVCTVRAGGQGVHRLFP